MSSLRRLLPYYRPYRRHVVVGLLLVAASAAFASVVPWLLRRALDGIRAGPPIMYLANTIVGGAFAIGFMLRIDARLTIIAALPLALLPALGILLGPRIHQRFEAVQEHFSDLTTLAHENLAGVRIVRAFRQEAAEIERFAALNEGYLVKN